jgi:hypothetical protein
MSNKRGKLRPQLWKTGPDPMIHRKYLPFLRARAQANFRLEDWLMSFDEYQQLWTHERWELRGKGTNDLCMTRVDHDGPWSIDNCHIVTRKQQLGEVHDRTSYNRDPFGWKKKGIKK